MSVYTTIEKHELEDFLGNYREGQLVDFRGISDGIENTNYFVDTRVDNSVRHYVLTIFEHHDYGEMQYYLNLMHHLADHDVPSANPVADREGHYLRMLKHKPAALVGRLDGSSIRETTVSHCRQIGEAMGKMHAAGLSFDTHQPNPRGPAWCTHTAEALQHKLDADNLDLLNEETRFQIANRETDIPRGVVHADLFRDNALWDGDTLSGIIDFYYACDDVLLYDLAVTANDWCNLDDQGLDRDKVTALLQGYHRYRPLLDSEQAWWPTMLRAGALRFWLSRLYDMHFPRPGELVHTKNPDEFRDILADRASHQDLYRSFWI